MIFYFILLPLLVVPVYVWYSSKKSAHLAKKYAERNVKYVESNSVFINLAKGKKPERESLKLIKANGKIYGSEVLGSVTITCAEPELVQLVLSTEFTNFINRRHFKLNNAIFDSFLSIVENDQWKRIRSVVTPKFATNSLRRMKPRLDETVITLTSNIDKAISQSPIVNVKQCYGQFTLDAICQVVFGVRVDSEEQNHQLLNNAKKVSRDLSLKRLIALNIAFIFPRLAKLLGVGFTEGVIEFFQEFSMEIIKRKRDELSKNENQGKANSFLELLLEAEAELKKQSKENKSDDVMTNDEIIGQCVLFFIAGHDTSASTLSLSAYLLALNPDKQEKLHNEIETVLTKLAQRSPETADPIQLVTLESLNKFEYLNAVISETLRIFLPAPFLERRAAKDISLQSQDGLKKMYVKAGDIISVPVWAMHRECFLQPEIFDPSRFIGDPQHHKYAYLPFGAGSRNCVARSLAILEVKLALLHTVRMFKFSQCKQTKVPMEFHNTGGVLTPKDVILSVEKR